MLEILSYSFIQNALIAGALVSILVGIMGSLIVVNRMTFLAGGIAHSAYGGIGLAIFLGLPIIFGATLFAVMTSMIIASITFNNRQRSDTIIGMMWALGMAIGIIFVDITPGYNVDLMSYLFGSIISVSEDDLLYMGVLTFIVLTVVTIFYKPILAVSYDREFAKLRGFPVKTIYTLILVLAALTVVAAIQVVGLILVIALLTIPTYLAESYANRLSMMMLLSGLFAALFTLIGLALAYMYDISSGASIIVVSIVALLILKGIKRL